MYVNAFSCIDNNVITMFQLFVHCRKRLCEENKERKKERKERKKTTRT